MRRNGLFSAEALHKGQDVSWYSSRAPPPPLVFPHLLVIPDENIQAFFPRLLANSHFCPFLLPVSVLKRMKNENGKTMMSFEGIRSLIKMGRGGGHHPFALTGSLSGSNIFFAEFPFAK